MNRSKQLFNVLWLCKHCELRALQNSLRSMTLASVTLSYYIFYQTQDYGLFGMLFVFQLTMNDFSVHRIIGRGGFGEVYGCRKADTGKM